MSIFTLRVSGDNVEKWLNEYGKKGLDEMEKISTSVICPLLTNYAKANAPWTDHTGAARSGLHSIYKRINNTTFRSTLAHGVDYGIFLELCNSGRFAILNPTAEALLPQIADEYMNAWR